MKKALIIFSSVLGAALLCAGVWFFLTTARQNAAAEAAHDAVLQEYAQLEQNAADTALTVTENGSEIGRYSLEALGVQRGTENAVAAAFSATDLMDAEAFSELPFRNKQNWDALPHPRGIRIPVDMDGFELNILSYTDAAHGYSLKTMTVEQDSEDLIESAIYRRNLSVENRFEELGIADDGYMLVLKITVPLVIVLSVIVVAALGSLASRAMLSPIRKIIKKIDKISADDLSERIDDVDSSDELRELTDRINAMLDNLEQSFDRQKKFVSDASHELKTPIAVIQGYSGLLKRWGKSDPEVLDESIDSIARGLGLSRSMINKELAAIRSGLKEKLESEDYTV